MSRIDPRTDEIAREAARLLETGKATSIGAAIRAAAAAIPVRSRDPFARPGATPGPPPPLPSRHLVRQHARGLALQALGERGYRLRRVDVWRRAEACMTLFEGDDPVLVGRAAEGNIDAGVTLHVHVHCPRRIRIGDCAQTLVDHGYDEPDVETADTPRGRFDRLRFEDEGVELVLTRLPRDRGDLDGIDLFTGRRQPEVDLETLRAMMAAECRSIDEDEPSPGP